jgi:hypothetical protein
MHNNGDKGIKDSIRNALDLDLNSSNSKYKNEAHFLKNAKLHNFWVGLRLIVSASMLENK